jgi:hypothetical protein
MIATGPSDHETDHRTQLGIFRDEKQQIYMSSFPVPLVNTSESAQNLIHDYGQNYFSQQVAKENGQMKTGLTNVAQETRSFMFESHFQLVPNNPIHEMFVMNSIRNLTRTKLVRKSPAPQPIQHQVDVDLHLIAQQLIATTKQQSSVTLSTSKPEKIEKTKKTKYNKKPKSSQVCSNCLIDNSPLWRSGPGGCKLCNKCGLYWKRYGKNRPLENINPASVISDLLAQLASKATVDIPTSESDDDEINMIVDRENIRKAITSDDACGVTPDTDTEQM